MRQLSWLVSIAVIGVFAPTAMAEEPPLPPPPPPPVVAPPAPGTTVAPTPDEMRRAVEMAPPESAPRPVYTMPPSSAPGCATCDPCPPKTCYQRRDDCGWAIDKCGCLYGPIDLTLEGMASWFSSPDGILGEIVSGNTDPLDWNDLDYPTAFGGRVTISYRFEAQSRIELRGTYWGNPDESSSDEGFFGALDGVFGGGDLSRGVGAEFETEAEMWGVELNWWTEISCACKTRVDVGFGLRYVHFDEQAHVDFTTIVGLPPGPFPVADGFVDADVTNQFFGGQFMIAAHHDVSQCFELYASGKGMFGMIRREIDIEDDSIFAGGLHSASSDDDEFVFGVDVELGFKWRILSRLAITGGYELFVLDGVQRAEDAMDFSHSSSGAVQARQSPDQIVVHSVFLGLSLNF